MSETIILSYAELQIAYLVAGQRQIQNMKKETDGKYGSEKEKEKGLERNIVGCIGEQAVAKYFGIYWSGAIGNYAAADVDKYQVRSTLWQNGHLVIHKEDKEAVFILCIVDLDGTCRLPGWIMASEGKKQEFWNQGQNGKRPAYFIPQSALKPMENIK